MILYDLKMFTDALKVCNFILIHRLDSFKISLQLILRNFTKNCPSHYSIPSHMFIYSFSIYLVVSPVISAMIEIATPLSLDSAKSVMIYC